MTTMEQSLLMALASSTSGQPPSFVNGHPHQKHHSRFSRFGGEGPELAVLDSTDLMCPGKDQFMLQFKIDVTRLDCKQFCYAHKLRNDVQEVWTFAARAWTSLLSSLNNNHRLKYLLYFSIYIQSSD